MNRLPQLPMTHVQENGSAALVWPLFLPLGGLGIILVADLFFVPGSTITPLGSIALLALLALRLPPVPLAIWAVVFTFAAFLMLIIGKSSSAPVEHDHITIIVRGATLMIGGTIAVLLSMHRIKLRSRHREVLSVLQKLPVPVIVSDNSGSVIFANDEAALLLQTSLSEIIGFSYFAFFVGEYQKGRAVQSYLKLLDSPSADPQEMEITLRNQPGQPLNATLVPLEVDGSKLLVTLFRKI
jgi:PAS domain-containing protein